jgi:hypothetical protein
MHAKIVGHGDGLAGGRGRHDGPVALRVRPDEEDPSVALKINDFLLKMIVKSQRTVKDRNGLTLLQEET